MKPLWPRRRHLSLVILLIACSVVPLTGAADLSRALAAQETATRQHSQAVSQTPAAQECSAQGAALSKANSAEFAAEDGLPAQLAILLHGEMAEAALGEQESPILTISPLQQVVRGGAGRSRHRATNGLISGQLASLVTEHVRLQI